MPDEPTGGAARPVMVYDGACSFCERAVRRWRNAGGGVVDFLPYQKAAGRYPQIPVEQFGRAVHLIEADGRVSRGAEAVYRGYALAGRRRWLSWAYRRVPVFGWVSELGYATVAAHRTAADRLDRLLIGAGTEVTSYQLTRQIFLRLLGVVYAIAFLSLWVQIDGLIGSKGILPIGEYLDAVRAAIGPGRYWEWPTIFWLNSGDAMLHWVCGGGVVAALMVVVGLLQLPALMVLFAFYLSLTVAGQDFLGFQWDALLLEAGFLAIFFAPWQAWARRPAAPSRVVLWLLRWLLFRLMFMSGLVKLTSGDATWKGWTALRYHYETQPLPSWVSWYFFQLPNWFQTFSCGVTFFSELIVPVLIFGPRRVRLLAFWGIIGFQLLIALTGNYGFFNLLTIVLCCTLPDDAFWRWVLRRRGAATIARSRWRWPVWVTVPVAAALLPVTVHYVIDASGAEVVWPVSLVQWERWLGPTRIANSYGLFRVMTTTRPEIIIEGSDDGETWKAYSFKWKPGDVTRAPEYVSPHMPRLDWQMWFAALGDYQSNPWIVNFMSRLIDGSPAVLGLMDENPFAGHPPKYVRAVLFQYHFTNWAEREKTGAWWRREPVGIYCQIKRRDPLDALMPSSP